MKPIVVVGSINMDLVTSTNRIPKPGETVIGSAFQTHSGGKGANQAVAVARLEYPSVMLGAVGEDAFGVQLLEALNGYGVNTSHVVKLAGASGTASIVVDAAGENTIIVTPGANSEVTPAYLEGKIDVLRSAGMVLAQLEIPIPTVDWLSKCCAEIGVPLMLDPAPAAELPPELLRRVTWFTPNQTEAAFYVSRDENPHNAVHHLRKSGIANIVLKRGSEGVLIAAANDEPRTIEAFPVQPVDTTAAGDAFNGAFSVALMQGRSINDAGSFAAAAAALCVTKSGAQPSMPILADVLAVL